MMAFLRKTLRYVQRSTIKRPENGIHSKGLANKEDVSEKLLNHNNNKIVIILHSLNVTK